MSMMFPLCVTLFAVGAISVAFQVIRDAISDLAHPRKSPDVASVILFVAAACCVSCMAVKAWSEYCAGVGA